MSEIAEQMLSRRRTWAHTGSGHDTIVRSLLWVLPGGIGVLGAFLVLAPLFMSGEVSFVLDKNKVEVAKQRLLVQSAEYRGQDVKGRPFRLNAGSAVQKSSTEPIVQLRDLSAEITLDDGPARIAADKGRYDMQKHQVAVDGPVEFRAADGYHLETGDSTVDLKTRTMTSDGAITGQTPMGKFSADEMSADLEKRTVRLDGNVRLRISPRKAIRR